MKEPIAGKFLLEILTKGMYSNPMHTYREYIQNSADSIDKAVQTGIIDSSEAYINISINAKKQTIVIYDNGVGIPKSEVRTKLLNVGASDKDGLSERGFRGIGRLGGLAYAEQVKFVTSAIGDDKKTVMTCDCVRLQQLLQKTNYETNDIMDTFTSISTFNEYDDDDNTHYFEVRLIGVPLESGLLDEDLTMQYLSETAPVDFDTQQFTQARKIRDFFQENGCPITCYKILRGNRKQPIYKRYSRCLSTGKQSRTKNKDYVRDVECFIEKASDGKPLYIGWLAITDFTGVISDDSVQGIRFRKGNILVGNNTTFSKFFPSEGHNANRMFAGEIHVLHDGLVPNSQRDDFEPSPIYNELKDALGKWAGGINKKYRRGTSEANSALRKLQELSQEQKQLGAQIKGGAITSDEKREQIAGKLDSIIRNREKEEKKVRAAFDKGVYDNERKETVEKTLSQTETDINEAKKLRTRICNSDYATKSDLPSSYNRDERKLYQRIISIIDEFFSESPETADKLRIRIRTELSEKKK